VVNPFTGIASLELPIFTPPCLSGFSPSISLTYNSNSGNGPFGLGWSLSLPSITRKTSTGLPRYQDAAESDIFVLSGTDDLVPLFKKDLKDNWMCDTSGKLAFDEEERDGYVIRHYQPRARGHFARVERWTRKTDGDTHWRSFSRDKVLAVYGRDNNSRIADSNDNSRVFAWLLCESYDDKGNAIINEYKIENGKAVDKSQANERNRQRSSNQYIKRIWYGNFKPLLLNSTNYSFRKSPQEQSGSLAADFMFEVVFDYGEDHWRPLLLDERMPETQKHQLIDDSASSDEALTSEWAVRPDPFSTYRAGFEIRTYRRCQRVLLFQRFPELGNEPCLVHSTEFNYLDLDYSKPVAVETELKHNGSTRLVSFVQTVTQSEYVFDEAKQVAAKNGVKHPTYVKESPLMLEFEYSQATIQNEIKTVERTRFLAKGLSQSRVWFTFCTTIFPLGRMVFTSHPLVRYCFNLLSETIFFLGLIS